jgi:hypothetical protein
MRSTVCCGKLNKENTWKNLGVCTNRILKEIFKNVKYFGPTYYRLTFLLTYSMVESLLRS